MAAPRMLAFVCRRLLATVPVLAMVAIFGFLVLRVHFMNVRYRWLRALDLNLQPWADCGASE
jgi:hypothetical protein